MAPPPMGRCAARASLLLLAALLVLESALGAAVPLNFSTTAAPAACPHSCRCFKADNLTAANCSSLSAVTGGGASHLRILRLTGFDEHLSVRAGAFSNFPHLQQLYLDRLGLTSLHPGAFRGLNALDTLSVSNNALSDPEEVSRVLRELPDLRRLILRGNNLGRDPILLPSWHSRSLKHLDIGRCKLSALPVNAFAGLSHLRHIVLDGNFVRDFRATAFPKSIVSVDISNNDIERFSRSEVSKLPHLDMIEIGGNPVRCSCELHKLSNDYNMNKPVVCALPKTLLGKNLLEVKKIEVCGHTKKVKREVNNDDYDEDVEESVTEPANADGETEVAAKEVKTTDTEYSENENNEDTKVQSERENEEEEKVETEGDEEGREEEKITAEGDEEETLGEGKADAVVNEEEKNEENEENNGSKEEEKEEAGETDSDTEPERVDEDDEDIEAIPNEDTAISNEEEGAHLINAGSEREGKAVENEGPVENTAAETVGDDTADGDGAETAEDTVDEEEETPKDVNKETNEGESEDDNVVIDDADKKSEEEKEQSEKETIDKIDKVLAEEREEEEAAERGDEKELKRFLGEGEEKPAGGEDGNEDDEAEGNENTADAIAAPEDVGENKNVEAGREGENEDSAVEGHVEGDSSENRNAENVEEPEKETDAENVEHDIVLPSLETREEVSEDVKETSAENVEESKETKDVVEEKEEENANIDESEDEVLEHHLPEAIEENNGEGETADKVDEKETVANSNENSADGEDGIDDDVENAASVVDGDEGEEERGAPFKTATGPFEETEKETAEPEDRENDVFGEDEDEDEPKHRHPHLEDHVENDDDVEAVVDDSGKIERTSDVGARTESDDADNAAEEEEVEEGTGKEVPEADEDQNALLGNSDPDKTEDEKEVKEDEEEETGMDGGAGAPGSGEETLNKEVDETEASEEKSEYTEDNGQDLGAARAIETDNVDDYEESDDEIKGEAAESAAENVDDPEAEETDDGNAGEGDTAVSEVEGEKENAKNTEADAEETKDGSVAFGEDEEEDVENVTDGPVPDLIPGGSISAAKGDHPVEGSGDEGGDGTEEDGTDSAEDETVKEPPKIPSLVDDYDYEEPATTPAPKEPAGDFVDPPVGPEEDGEEEEEDEDEYSGAGSVPVFVIRGDDDETSGEEREGSGDAHSAHVAITTLPPVEHEDKEESSGDYGYIPGFDGDGDTSTERIEHKEHEEETPMPPPAVDEGEEEDDTLSGFFPTERQEDEIEESGEVPTEAPIVKTHVVHVDASFIPTEDEEKETGKEEVEGDDGRGEEEETAKEELDPSFVTERPSDRGRALVPPVVASAPAAPVAPAAPAAPASPTGETRMNEDLKEAESASGDSEDSLTNNVGSYVVLGVIMVIVVALLAYAVIRSRTKKSTKGKKNDADLENGGARELQDVSKPLINNHHPNGTAVGGEKQKLEDETREPLMTKEQEASLTTEPEDREDGPKKQNGGVVPEVVIEPRPAPVGMAKTPTKTPPPTPVDAEAPVPINGKATTPSDAPVNGAATPLVNGGTTPDTIPPTPLAPQQQPVSPGAVRVVAKELPDSVAKKPIIITNRGADPAQQV